jgi:signal transduction histidine kinase
MSLRTRIFLLSSGVILLLLAAEWWLVDSLRQRLRGESAAIAREVGIAVIEDNDWLAWADARRKSAAVMARNAAADGAASDAAAPAPVLFAVPAVPATRIPAATARLDAMAHDFQVDMLLGSLGILLVGLLATAAMAKTVTRPLQGLAAAAAAIADGRFGAQVATIGEPRFDAAIAAFNRMSARLSELEAEARAAQERSHLTELGEIARGIAHSLRNPLHALGLSLAELAREDRSAPPRAEFAATCQAQIDRIDRSLRSILSLAANSTQPASRIDVAEVVQDVVMEAAQVAGGRVQIDCDLGDRPTIQGVGAEVRTALHVLVCNAVEASAHGGSVAVRIAGDRGSVQVLVEDQGPGLTAAVRARLFQPHVTTKEQGAGLGLFLAERIARRRYGGSLVLADRQPRGLRAVLTLRDAVPSAHAV